MAIENPRPEVLDAVRERNHAELHAAAEEWLAARSARLQAERDVATAERRLEAARDAEGTLHAKLVGRLGAAVLIHGGQAVYCNPSGILECHRLIP